jgi:twitching motility protein PilT
MAQAFAWDDGAESELSAPFEKKTEEIRLFGHSTHGDGQQARMRPIEGVHVDEILEEGLLRGASDVHIHCGLPPVFRVDGSLVRSDYEPLDARTIQRLVYDILTGEQVGRLEAERELDLSYSMGDRCRFRVNVFRQKGSYQAAFRLVPSEIPDMDELRLPPVLRKLTQTTSGLIMVTGPTGSGKSTTIAAMIDHINQTRSVHIITLEDPIEYLHRDKRAMVTQRELHSDTDSFHNALRAILREDPDVILVGEMRDLETISAALTLAETGHLVFATLHTRNAAQTVDRIVDVLPPHQQEQIRVQLSNTLEAVISQLLLPLREGGRVVAVEVLVATSGIRNLIREGKTHQIGTAIETGTNLGMQPMDRSLAELATLDLISLQQAKLHATDPENLERYLGER